MLESCAKATASKKRLRILFLAPFAPNLQAGHGGARVIAQLISHLGKQYEVGLCYLRSANEPTVDDTLKKRCEVIEEVILPHVTSSARKRWSRRRRVWKEVLAGKPLWAIDRFSPAYAERLKSLLVTWKPDIVQFEFHVMGQYLPALEDYPGRRILVDHEPGVESAREVIGSSFAQGKLMPILDLMAWRRFEPEIVRQVDTVVVFTDRDRTAIRNLGQKTPMVQIALGTEVPECTTTPATQDSLNLLFIGNFKHPPNLDAADRLINSVFPQVQSKFSGARLFIVGAHLPANVLQNANPNVVTTGYVSDVTPYLERASLVVIPLRLGGGMRVKTLEALAAGKAIVASARAVEGLDVINGQHLVLAESDEEFVETIADLLNNTERRLALATQAHEWASANLSWERSAAEYEKLYRCLLRC
jgi:glycosyltransferase involved in cell wall biosynthesis